MSTLTIEFSSAAVESLRRQTPSVMAELEAARVSLLSFGDRMLASEVEPTEPGPVFFRLPEWTHADYVRRRQASPLGQIFGIANGMHDHGDSVIVCDASRSPMRALFAACCHPLHNQLGRGDRGSKPRMYFCDETIDGELLEALATDVIGAERRPSRPYDRTSLVFNRPRRVSSTPPSRLESAFSYLAQQLRLRLAIQADEWMPRLVSVIGPASEAANDRDRDARIRLRRDRYCVARVPQPRRLATDFAAFTPATLLPAAMLGLDCVKLLQGAAEMNRRLAQEPAGENPLLRLAAAKIASDRWRRVTAMASLDGLCRWRPQGISPADGAGDLPSPAGLIETLEVVEGRTDVIVPASCFESSSSENRQQDFAVTDSATENPAMRFFEFTRTQIQADVSHWDAIGCPVVRLVLPKVDTRSLGQWLQLQLIVDFLTRRVDASR